MSYLSGVLAWLSVFFVVIAIVARDYKAGKFWLQFAIYAILLSFRLAL